MVCCYDRCNTRIIKRWVISGVNLLKCKTLLVYIWLLSVWYSGDWIELPFVQESKRIPILNENNFCKPFRFMNSEFHALIFLCQNINIQKSNKKI